MTKRKKDDEIPVIHLAGAAFSLCIELLSRLQEEGGLELASGGIKENFSDDSLEYAGRVEPGYIELKREAIFPLKCLFGTDVILFNYSRFYL